MDDTKTELKRLADEYAQAASKGAIGMMQPARAALHAAINSLPDGGEVVASVVAAARNWMHPLRGNSMAACVRLREAVTALDSSAPTTQPQAAASARPQALSQDARDAAKYRFLLARMKVGAVRTQLPLNRVAYWYGFEDCFKREDADAAIEAQMAADYEQGKGTSDDQ